MRRSRKSQAMGGVRPWMRTGGKSHRCSNEPPAVLTPQILMLPYKGDHSLKHGQVNLSLPPIVFQYHGSFALLLGSKLLGQTRERRLHASARDPCRNIAWTIGKSNPRHGLAHRISRHGKVHDLIDLVMSSAKYGCLRISKRLPAFVGERIGLARNRLCACRDRKYCRTLDPTIYRRQQTSFR